MPMLVMLKEHRLPSGEVITVPDRYVRASDFEGSLGQANNAEWKTVACNEAGEAVLPNGSIGFRWGPEGRSDAGKWNLEAKEAQRSNDVKLKLSLLEGDRPTTATAKVGFPTGGIASEYFPHSEQGGDVLVRTVPVQRISLGADKQALIATVFDLLVGNYGVAWVGRRVGGEEFRRRHTVHAGLARAHHRSSARAGDLGRARISPRTRKTHGRSMVIIGAAMNHWYHSDMNYRGVINMLMMCGCVGQSGGGWAHYVGQEKLRPQTGWTALAFALDWIRPPRLQNSTSFSTRIPISGATKKSALMKCCLHWQTRSNSPAA